MEMESSFLISKDLLKQFGFAAIQATAGQRIGGAEKGGNHVCHGPGFCGERGGCSRPRVD
jgi:hypothetical protein